MGHIEGKARNQHNKIIHIMTLLVPLFLYNNKCQWQDSETTSGQNEAAHIFSLVTEQRLV